MAVFVIISMHTLLSINLLNYLGLLVPGSIPGGVTGDFFRGPPDATMCPGGDSARENEYQGFILG